MCSSSDDLCLPALISIIENVPIKNLVDHVTSKVLLSCLRLSQKDNNLPSSGNLHMDLYVWLCHLADPSVFHKRVSID